MQRERRHTAQGKQREECHEGVWPAILADCRCGPGAAGTVYFMSEPPQALAANDRYEDYVIPGPVEVLPKTPTDGVWVLDYKGASCSAPSSTGSRGKS